MFKKFLLFFTFCFPLSNPALSAVSPSPFTPLLFSLEKEAFQGVLLIAQGDHILVHKAFGESNHEKHLKNSLSSQFMIASITKQFTAAAILKLAEEDKVDLQAPLSKAIPPASSFWQGKIPDWATKVSLHHLLSHSSGAPDYLALEGFEDFYKTPHSSQELIGFFKDAPLEFEPGTKFEYSGTGYNLLGAVIEEVTHKKYGAYLKDTFFIPLGMHDTSARHDALLSQITKELPYFSKRYSFKEDQFVPTESISEVNLSTYYAEACIISTALDLLKWTQALYRGKILTSKSLAEMHRPYFPISKDTKKHTGYGVFSTQTPQGPAFFHDGGTEGVRSLVLYVPHQDLTLILLANTDRVNLGAYREEFLKLLEKMK